MRRQSPAAATASHELRSALLRDMPSDLSSAPIFAAGLESKRGVGGGADDMGSRKVARLEELRARLSPPRASSFLPPPSECSSLPQFHFLSPAHGGGVGESASAQFLLVPLASGGIVDSSAQSLLVPQPSNPNLQSAFHASLVCFAPSPAVDP